MVEKLITSRRNVIDFARYQQDRAVGKAQAISVRICRYCGAALADGENEDECSSAFNIEALNTETSRLRTAPRKFYAE
ncbi:MAG: hypothetical protein ACJ8FZ_11975 [Bradyrhizobium sp.]|jgi:hypothetical protein